MKAMAGLKFSPWNVPLVNPLVGGCRSGSSAGDNLPGEDWYRWILSGCSWPPSGLVPVVMLCSSSVTDLRSRLILLLGSPRFSLSKNLIERSDLGKWLGGVWVGGFMVGWAVGGGDMTEAVSTLLTENIGRRVYCLCCTSRGTHFEI